jgi:hypothetical protein
MVRLWPCVLSNASFPKWLNRLRWHFLFDISTIVGQFPSCIWGSHSSDCEDLWGVTLCSLVEVHKHVGGRYCLHLHRQRICQANIQQEGSKLHSEFSPKRRQTSAGLHDIISQKLILFEFNFIYFFPSSSSYKKKRKFRLIWYKMYSFNSKQF